MWVICDGRVVAAAEVAATRAAGRHGLLGRDGVEGALVLRRARQVHTIGMRFAIDVAWCDRRGRVLRVETIAPGRVSRIVWRAATVIEATAGAMVRWGVVPGARIEVVGEVAE